MTGFQQYPSEALKLLQVLVTDGKMTFQNDSWKDTVQTACLSILAEWTPEERPIAQIQYILPLLPQLPGLTPAIARIVDSILKSQIDPHQNYQDTAANVGWCLGACLVALSTVNGWAKDINVDAWFKACIDKYHWNAKVLEGLVEIARLWYVLNRHNAVT